MGTGISSVVATVLVFTFYLLAEKAAEEYIGCNDHQENLSVADEAFAKLAQIVGQDVFEKKVYIVGGTRLANRLINFVLKTRRKN
ncbi:MAG: hypothetical protein OXE97_06295 [Gammaproteobacteria bacterium]|nr:hypothetical protein [Gammaproteobacteria bacterium]MCY4283659.1 hypothetical protein [Gammaproteobacteria bacterium]